MTLFEFIEANGFPRNAYVKEKDFKFLYVRIGRRWLNDRWVPCLEIANVYAKKTGQGSFTRLIQQIQLNFPKLWIYVENVQTERFAAGLKRLGFKDSDLPRCYHLEPVGWKSPSSQPSP